MEERLDSSGTRNSRLSAVSDSIRSAEQWYDSLSLAQANVLSQAPQWKRDQIAQWSKLRRVVDNVLSKTEWLVGVVVLINLACIARETDLLISGGVKTLPYWLKTANLAFITFYIWELSARLYVERIHFFSSSWNNLDFSVVILGVVGEIMEGVFDSVSILRTLRLLRMMRIVRVLDAFKELWALIRDMMDCFRTLAWAFLLLAVTLTIWSIFSVELLHNLMDELEEEGAYTNCSWCPTAFSSVSFANLTLFQIISGDGWSQLARPLIEKHPWTAIIFVGVIFTFCFGFLNILVAVMVENSATGRQADFNRLVKEKEEARRIGKAKLLNICKEIDADQNGVITVEEVAAAASTMEDFQRVLKVMDIGDDDIECVFALLDEDKSGTVDYEEFTEQLWKIKSHESHTTTMIMKYYIMQIWQKISAQTERLQNAYLEESQAHRADVHKMEDEIQQRMDASQDSISNILALLAPRGTSRFTRAGVERPSYSRENGTTLPRSESHPENVTVEQKDATARENTPDQLKSPRVRSTTSLDSSTIHGDEGVQIAKTPGAGVCSARTSLSPSLKPSIAVLPGKTSVRDKKHTLYL